VGQPGADALAAARRAALRGRALRRPGVPRGGPAAARGGRDQRRRAPRPPRERAVPRERATVALRRPVL
ncbi:MAG: Dihydrofolate reductase, partial [uncultured Actinomycetospora sp.]